MSLNTNITNLRELLDKVNALPETNSGVELPKLSNEGIADDLVEGKELIDSTGNIITGTNPYEKVATDNAIAAEANLIAQIQTALEGKSSNSANSSIQWNEIASLPTSYAIEDDTNTTYYIRLPSKNCWVLFNSPSMGIGCYDVIAGRGLYDFILSNFLVIEESNEIYLQFTTTMTSDHYYAIIEIQEV